MVNKLEGMSREEAGTQINAEAAALAGKVSDLFNEARPNLLVALLALMGVAASVLRRMEDVECPNCGELHPTDMLAYAQGLLATQLNEQRSHFTTSHTSH